MTEGRVRKCHVQHIWLCSSELLSYENRALKFNDALRREIMMEFASLLLIVICIVASNRAFTDAVPEIKNGEYLILVEGVPLHECFTE